MTLVITLNFILEINRMIKIYLVISSAVFIIMSLHFKFINGQGVEGLCWKIVVNIKSFSTLLNDWLVLPIRPVYTWNTQDQVTTLLNKPYSPATYASMSSYIYQLYGEQAIIDIESVQACRLNSNPCHKNSECCSKYCRCTRWNSLGKEVCWRRCLWE